MTSKKNVDLAATLSALLAPGSNIVSSDPSDHVKYWDERYKIDPERTMHEWENIIENIPKLGRELGTLSNTEENEAIQKIKDINDRLKDEARSKIRSLIDEQRNKLKREAEDKEWWWNKQCVIL